MDLGSLAEQVGTALLQRGWMVATAESCTGGWVAKVFTDIAGSSRWFDRGFITYSNQAKIDMLGVEAATLAQSGAVSEAVVTQMAMGACGRSNADIAVAISGIAGPGGGSADKPVGTVWFAWAFKSDKRVSSLRCHYMGDRESVRAQAVAQAMAGLLERVPRA